MKKCKHKWDDATKYFPGPIDLNGLLMYTKYWRCVCPKCKQDISEFEVYYDPKIFRIFK